MITHKWSDIKNDFIKDNPDYLRAVEQEKIRLSEEQDPRVAQCLKEENTGNQHRRRHKITERILEARVWSVLERITGENESRTNTQTSSSETKKGS